MENSKLNFLKESIATQINKIDSRKNYYRKQALYIYMTTSILSAVATILLGLKIQVIDEYVRILAMVITTIITVINAYNVFFNHKELWVTNNAAKNKFNKLKFDIAFDENEEGAITKEVIDNYKNTYQEILNELNAAWTKNRITIV